MRVKWDSIINIQIKMARQSHLSEKNCVAFTVFLALAFFAAAPNQALASAREFCEIQARFVETAERLATELKPSMNPLREQDITSSLIAAENHRQRTMEDFLEKNSLEVTGLVGRVLKFGTKMGAHREPESAAYITLIGCVKPINNNLLQFLSAVQGLNKKYIASFKEIEWVTQLGLHLVGGSATGLESNRVWAYGFVVGVHSHRHFSSVIRSLDVGSTVTFDVRFSQMKCLFDVCHREVWPTAITKN